LNHFTRRAGILFIGIFCLFSAIAQETGMIFGKVTDNRSQALELVNIAVMGLPGGNVTDRNGEYELSVPAGEEITVVFSFVGYNSQRAILTLDPGERKEINISLTVSTTVLPDVVVEDRQIRTSTLSRIDPKEAAFIPTVSGSAVESLIKTMPGVAAMNELTSQYSVRGGNYDENLVYVNDIEIYRPFLVRASQQEGLSFLNSDLVSAISFSAGGFDPKYGDKMSSVLDIKYKQPKEFAGSFSASLLGATFHLEGATPNQKVYYLLGTRYKTNQYVLNALETQGEYKPNFLDIQTLIGYRLNEKWDFSFLGYISRNSYKMQPETRETAFGAINQAYKFTVYYEGQEIDNFLSYLGGVTAEYRPTNSVTLKFISSAYRTIETETYDLLAQYWLARLETDFSDDEFGQPTETLGVGSYLDHARNEMDAWVFNVEHRGIKDWSEHYVQWGIKYQHEYIDDVLNSWALNDSAGYSLPHPPDSIGYTDPSAQPVYPFNLYYYGNAHNILSTNRYTAFVQDSWSIVDKENRSLLLIGGVRMQYWDYNKDLLISPRATVAFNPGWKTDMILRFSAGIYYQAPFYREMRDFDGTLNTDPVAQKSWHFVLGSDWNFTAWGRPFKFISEVYYKKFGSLVPYVLDNLMIRYYAFDRSHGYAVGLDMKVNGEFVKGIESWASLSILKTMEDIDDDMYYNRDSVLIEPGYIRRPTDQRLSIGMFFQDYLPKNPTYKMHLSLIYGTNLPFWPPGKPKNGYDFKSSNYFRVDIGFSKQLISKATFFSPKNPLRVFESAWISLEIFNLLQHLNVVSYTWIEDIYGRPYPVPNRLTPRQVNVKLVANF